MIEPSIRGRGVAIQTPNRFDSTHYAIDPDLDEPPPEDPRTEYIPDATKTIIVHNQSPDIGFNASINVYRGCEHGCCYCFARPSHEYLGYSAGLDFETKIVVKYDAPALLRKELMAPRYKPERIAMSMNSDCYQPAERRFQLTRGCLAVLAEFRNPVSILTKNALVTRDIDLFVQLAAVQATSVFLSITSLDNDLIGVMEPRTSRPAARLGALRALADAGIPCGVMIGPIIPGLTDPEVPAILEAAAAAGARWAAWTALRLPWAVKPIVIDWLERHYPDRMEKVLNHVREMRGGKLNESAFHKRHHPDGEYMNMIRTLFHATCRKLGLNRERRELSTAAFQRPGDQLKLF
ncbi:MAG: PA0069 family radical SAM protein [bacterium]